MPDESEKLEAQPSVEKSSASTRPATSSDAASEKGTAVEPPPEKTEQEPPNTEEQEEIVEYPSTTKLALISFGLCLACFVVALDNTIIATAIPTIVTRFNSLPDVGWYGSAYLLTLTSLQPSFGKIYANFDLKITYLIAVVIFEVGSIVCAAAPNSEALIVGRAVAGVGASGIFSGGMNIIAYAVPLEKRAIYVAVLSSMFGIASVVGPLLGGAFTDRVSWRLCFWINLPFGACAFVAVLVFFTSPKRKHHLTVREKIAQIDILGAFLLVGGITCLLLALQWGGTTYAWSDSKIWGLLIGFVLIIALFIFVQFRRKGLATIPPTIFSQRTVLVSALFTAFFSMAMYIHIYYLPFYFQAIKGTSAVGSGIRTIPYLVSITISSIVVGTVITVTGNYADFLWIGSIIFTAGAIMISFLDVDSNTGNWLGYQVLAGVGGGAAVQVPFLAVQVALKVHDAPIGTSIIMFFNSLGGAISISIAQNIFSNRLVKEIPQYAPNVDPSLILQSGATHLKEIVPPDALDAVLRAYAKALDTTFIPAIAFAGLTIFIALFIERINVKGQNLMVGGAA